MTNDTNAELAYYTHDLGWRVVGMDAGNLDEDDEDEIVVGTWIDDGTYEDWRNGIVTKNRGHLIILNAGPTPGRFLETELNGDGPIPGSGLGSSVFGVRIDDVDADGQAEIWCGDNLHLYLFRKNGSSWDLAARTDHLGMVPGQYNNIFPIKDAGGHTVRVVAASSGYVMAFDVDWGAL